MKSRSSVWCGGALAIKSLLKLMFPKGSITLYVSSNKLKAIYPKTKVSSLIPLIIITSTIGFNTGNIVPVLYRYKLYMVNSHFVGNRNTRVRELERDLFNRDDFITHLKQERLFQVDAEITSRGISVNAGHVSSSSSLNYTSPYAILQHDIGNSVDKLILNFNLEDSKGMYDDNQDTSSLDSLCYSLSSDRTEDIDNIEVVGNIEDVDDYCHVFDKPNINASAAFGHHLTYNINVLDSGKDTTINDNGGVVDVITSRVDAVADTDNDTLFGDSIIASALEMNNYNSPVNRDILSLPHHQHSCKKRSIPLPTIYGTGNEDYEEMVMSDNISQPQLNIGKEKERKRRRGEHNDYQKRILKHLYSHIPKNKYPEGSLLRAFNNKMYREDISTINSQRDIDKAYRKWRKEEAYQRRLLRIQKRRKNKGYTLEKEDEEDEDDDYINTTYNV